MRSTLVSRRWFWSDQSGLRNIFKKTVLPSSAQGLGAGAAWTAILVNRRVNERRVRVKLRREAIAMIRLETNTDS